MGLSYILLPSLETHNELSGHSEYKDHFPLLEVNNQAIPLILMLQG